MNKDAITMVQFLEWNTVWLDSDEEKKYQFEIRINSAENIRGPQQVYVKILDHETYETAKHVIISQIEGDIRFNAPKNHIFADYKTTIYGTKLLEELADAFEGV